MLVEVVPCHLDLAWPDTQLNILMVHPELDWHLRQEGYVQTGQVAQRSVRLLETSVQLAGHYGGAQLILVPEYGLPARDFDKCRDVLGSLPVGTVCMTGFDAMKPEQWAHVCNGAVNGEQLKALQGVYTWVNTAAIWVKTGPDELKYYLQPKLVPAPAEDNGIMLCGRHVLCFQVGHWRLTQLICYDFMAPRDGDPKAPMLRAVIDAFKAHGDGRPEVDLFIVLQANDQPGHDGFVRSAAELIAGQEMRAGAVVFANIAGRPEYSRFYLPRPLRSGLLEDPTAPVSAAQKVFRFQKVTHLDAAWAGFREPGPAVHWVQFRSPLKVDADPRTRNYLNGVLLARAGDNGDLEELQSVTALQHHCCQAYRQAFTKIGQLPAQCEDVQQSLRDAYAALGSEFRTGLSDQRVTEIITTLLGRPGTVQDWEEHNRHYDDVMALVLALSILRAGGAPLELRLEDRRDAASREDIVHRPITAYASDFSLDVYVGDSYEDTVTLLQLYLGINDRHQWLPVAAKRHICLLLKAADSDDQLTPVDQRQLRRLGPRRALRYDDERLGPQPGELALHIGSSSRLWTYHYRGLQKLITEATSAAELKDLTREVFGWTAA